MVRFAHRARGGCKNINLREKLQLWVGKTEKNHETKVLRLFEYILENFNRISTIKFNEIFNINFHKHYWYFSHFICKK